MQKHIKINLLKHKHSVMLLPLRRELMPHRQTDRQTSREIFCTRPHCPRIILFYKRTFLVVQFTLRSLYFFRFFFLFADLFWRCCIDEATDDCLHSFLDNTRISRESQIKGLKMNQQKPEDGLNTHHSISKQINWFQHVDSFYTPFFEL